MDMIAENDVVACSGIDGIPVSIDRRNNDSGFEKLGQIMAVMENLASSRIIEMIQRTTVQS